MDITSDTGQQPARYRRYLHDDGYYYEVQPLGPARRVGHPGYGMAPAEDSLAYPQEKRLFDKRKAEWEETQRRKAAKASSGPGVSGQLSAVPSPEPENDQRSLHYEYEFNYDSDRFESVINGTPLPESLPPGPLAPASEHWEYLRALREKQKLQEAEAPAPPPEPGPENDDNAKIARHEEELAGQLLIAIASAGEGGWRSPFYTGAAYTLSSHQVHPYALWKNARDSWTTTGDRQYLEALLDAVDFTNPPEVPRRPVTGDAPARARLSRKMRQGTLLAMLAVYAVIVLILITIGAIS